MLRWGCVLTLGPALLDAGWSPTLFLKWFGGTSAVQTTVFHQIYLIGVVSAWKAVQCRLVRLAQKSTLLRKREPDYSMRNRQKWGRLSSKQAVGLIRKY